MNHFMCAKWIKNFSVTFRILPGILLRYFCTNLMNFQIAIEISQLFWLNRVNRLWFDEEKMFDDISDIVIVDVQFSKHFEHRLDQDYPIEVSLGDFPSWPLWWTTINFIWFEFIL